MNVFNSLRIIILTIVCAFLNIPYGIDAPDRATHLGSTFDSGAIVCEQSDEGFTASFSASYRLEYRNQALKGGTDKYELKVFTMQPEDVITPHDDPAAFLTHRQYIDDEEGHPALENVTYSYTVEGGKVLIRDGSEFTMNVKVILPPGTPSGTYSIVTSFSHDWETIYRDVLIVP